MKYIGNLLLGLGFGGALAAFAVGCGGEGDTGVFATGSTSGAGGNGGMSGTGSGTGGASGCATSADCDDGFSCTIDACNAGVCAHVVGPNSGPTACPAGTLCELGKGCTQVIVCATDDQCIQQLGNDACKVNIHCDGATSTCTYTTLDKDNDGHAPIVCGGGDCNDAAPDVFPGAPEVCDGKDNACDGKIDNGATCPGGVCQNGSCSCPPANTCGTECVDKSTDPNHCGMCNNVCPGAASCVNGQCACPMGSTVCGGVCVDTKTNAQNCGGCGKTCAPGYACANGFCTCLGTPCGAQCIDTSSDPLNCGGCNVVCPAGTACQNGACSCMAPFALCNGQCVDTTTNPSHCGGCNKPCSGLCQNGVCQQQCTVANLHVLFDISGSMSEAAIGGTRLEIARTGVNAFMNDALSSNMGFGIGYHPIAGTGKTCLGSGTPCMVDADCGGFPFPLCQAGGDSCTVSDYATPAVGIALLPGVKTAISNSLAAKSPTGGSTPPPGLQGALQYAKAYAMSHAGQKVGVVFMADDLPNICTSNNDLPTDLIPIAQQYANGSPKVVTYVIGIGTGASPDPTLAQWNQIATAGGTGSAYVVNSAVEVQSALAAIRSQFKTCP